MDTGPSTSIPMGAGRRSSTVGVSDTFSFGRPSRPRRWPYAILASAVAASVLAASAVSHGVAPTRGLAFRLVSDQTTRPFSPLQRHVQLGHFGGVQQRAVWVRTPAGAPAAPGAAFVPSTQGGAVTGGSGSSGTAGSDSAGSTSAGGSASASDGSELAPAVAAPVAPAAPGLPLASPSSSPSASPSDTASPSPTDSPSASPSSSDTASSGLAPWVADCDMTDPGTAPGTAAWNVYWQHHPSPTRYGFPVDQMNCPCGPDWIIIPGSDPYTPPVWSGTVAPFQPPTNLTGGQMFIAAADATGAQPESELGAVGVPISDSGQLLAYGADGTGVRDGLVDPGCPCEERGRRRHVQARLLPAPDVADRLVPLGLRQHRGRAAHVDIVPSLPINGGRRASGAPCFAGPARGPYTGRDDGAPPPRERDHDRDSRPR